MRLSYIFNNMAADGDARSINIHRIEITLDNIPDDRSAAAAWIKTSI